MPHKVLLIEDDLDCSDLLAEVLAIEGHESVSVGTAAEASEALRLGQFSLVLSDLRVPGAGPNGDIVRMVREAGYSGRLILLSGDANIREIARLHNVEFYAKPYSMDELLSLLAQ